MKIKNLTVACLLFLGFNPFYAFSQEINFEGIVLNDYMFEGELFLQVKFTDGPLKDKTENIFFKTGTMDTFQFVNNSELGNGVNPAYILEGRAPHFKVKGTLLKTTEEFWDLGGTKKVQIYRVKELRQLEPPFYVFASFPENDNKSATLQWVGTYKNQDGATLTINEEMISPGVFGLNYTMNASVLEICGDMSGTLQISENSASTFLEEDLAVVLTLTEKGIKFTMQGIYFGMDCARRFDEFFEKK
jgi:hypothetical protein